MPCNKSYFLLVHSSLQHSPAEVEMTVLFLRRARLDEGPTEGWWHPRERNLEEMVQLEGVFRGHENAVESEATDGSRFRNEFVFRGELDNTQMD